MRPRTNYRATLIVLALSGILAVVGVVAGNWLPAAAMVLVGLSGLITRARRPA